MEYIGYFASIIIGLSLGLIGGGGSILTIPILVYLFKIDPELATSYSLFIVGITSLSGDNFNSQAKETDLTIEQYNQLVKDCNSSGGTVKQRGVYDFNYSPTYVTCYKDGHEFKMKPEIKNVP